MTRRTIALFAAATSLGTIATAQAAWTQLTPANSPSPRAGHVGVTDGGSMYLFGGKPGPTSELNDMWQFDGANWTDITPTAGPLPQTRHFYAGTYDTSRGVYVLFGGRSGSTNLGDTWEFDGTSWTQLSPATSPSARRWASMAYDAVQGVCILFGGNGAAGYNNETWSWNGTNWTRLTPTTSPSIRGRGRLSFDITRGEMLYYGGRNTAGALGDTWIWDGSDWRQVTTTTTGPGSLGVQGLFAYGATYDLVRDRHVVFGGTRTGGTLAGCWEFDGTDWEQRNGGPPSRTGCSLAFIPGLGKTFLFGGFSTTQLVDTWEYQTSPLAQASTFGSGCPGGGTGNVTLSPTNLPWTGDTFEAAANGVGATSLVFSVVGLSNSNWAGGSLPTALSTIHPAGGAGCNLLVRNDAVLLLGNQGGVVTVPLPLPNDPGFAGLTLYQQVLEIELDPSFNIQSINASNGVTILVGAR
ncbi:MAG: hypothetical protein NXI31_16835 [bacterium]|nr:hypothetical protein [bacterium]